MRRQHVSAAHQVGLGGERLHRTQRDPRHGGQHPARGLGGHGGAVGVGAHDPVEAGGAQVAADVLGLDGEALGGPAQARARDPILQERGQERAHEVAGPAGKQGHVSTSGPGAVAGEEVGAVAFALGGDVLQRRAHPSGPQVEAVQHRVPEAAVVRASSTQREVEPGPSEAGRAQPLQAVGPNVAPVQEDGDSGLALVAGDQRHFQSPAGGGEPAQLDGGVQVHGLVVLEGGRAAKLSKEPSATSVRGPRVQELAALHAPVEGGHQAGVPQPSRQPKFVHPDFARDDGAGLVRHAQAELAHRRQVGRSAPVLQNHGVGRIRGPEHQRRVSGRPGFQDQPFLGPSAQLQPRLELHHHLGQPILLTHGARAAGRGQSGAVQVEVAVVGAGLQKEPSGHVRSRFAPHRRHPQTRLAVRQEVPGPLGEPVVDLHPSARRHVFERDGQRPLVELDPLPAERRRRIVELLHHPRRRHVGVARGELGHGTHLHAAAEGRRVARQAGQDARRVPLEPRRADDAQARQDERVAAPARHREPQVAHGPELGLADRAAHVEARRIAQGNAIEPESGAGLVAIAHQEGRGAVQGHHEPPVALQHVQVAVFVQVLGVRSAVAPRAVGVGVAQPVHAGAFGKAVFVPHAASVGHVAPDFAPARVGLLVQRAQPPRHARPGLHAVQRARRVGEEGVLAHHAHVQHQAQEVAVAHVELHEVALGQVGPGGTQHGGDRRPRAGTRPVATGGREAHVQARLADGASRDPDLLVDVGGGVEALEDAHAVAGGAFVDPRVLPRQRRQAGLGQLRRKLLLGPVAKRGPASQPPVLVAQRKGARVLPVEVVHVHLALDAGVGQGDGGLARQPHGGAVARVQPRHRVQQAGQQGRVEAHGAVQAAEPHGAGLHAELRPPHQLVLRLVEARQIHGAVVPQVVAGVHAEGRGRRRPEEASLLPRRLQHAVRVGPQKAVRVHQHELSHVVVDQVVHVADQHLVAQRHALRALADAHRAQGERRRRPFPPHFVGQVQAEDAAVLPLEGVRVLVDGVVAVRAQHAPGFLRSQRQAAKGGRPGEGRQRGEDHEGAGHGRQVLERLQRRPVDVGLVQAVAGGLFVQPEEAEPRQVVSVGPAGEGPAAALLAQGHDQLHRAGVHVVGGSDAVDLVHLGAPRGPTRLVLGGGRLEQPKPRTPAGPMDALGVVGAHGVAGRRDVRDRQHLVGAQGASKRHPEAAGVHQVVGAGPQVAEPRRLGDGVVAFARGGVRLDVALHLLLRVEVDLRAVELNRVGAGNHRRRRVGRGQRQDVQMGVRVEGGGVEEEEELAVHVVGVVQHQGVGAGEAQARTVQAEGARRDLASLLCPHGLNLDRTGLEGGLEAEVAGGHALSEEARRRQVEAHVAHLQALKELAGPALVAKVEAVGAGEGAGLVVVHVHQHAAGDGAVGGAGKLDVGAEPRQEGHFAGDLDGFVAGAEPGPVAAQLARAAEGEAQVGVLGAEARDLGRPSSGRAGGGGRGDVGGAEGAAQGADAQKRTAAPVGAAQRRQDGRGRVLRVHQPGQVRRVAGHGAEGLVAAGQSGGGNASASQAGEVRGSGSGREQGPGRIAQLGQQPEHRVGGRARRRTGRGRALEVGCGWPGEGGKQQERKRRERPHAACKRATSPWPDGTKARLGAGEPGAEAALATFHVVGPSCAAIPCSPRTEQRERAFKTSKTP